MAVRDAMRAMAAALAAVVTPPDPLPPSVWAATNLVVPDGPRAGDAWSLDLTPYIREPLDLIGPDSPVNELAVMKGVQTGFTTLLIAAIGHSIDRDPCNMILLQPTSDALSDFNRTKLEPALSGTKALKRKVQAQTSRSSTGSTTHSKKFPGGTLTLSIASSGAALRSKTAKKLFRDEIDEYEDIEGQGDPLELSDGRLTSFLADGSWKKVDISTPTVKGSSKIEQRYNLGDKRKWFVPCPHCAEPFTIEYGPNFRYNESYPFNAFFVAPCCGGIIGGAEKNALMRKGQWVATDSRPGAFPSYQFPTFFSPFVPWDHIAKLVVEAGSDPIKLKSLYNLWFGLPYEFKGDAPDHERLMERREDEPQRGHVPARGLMLIAAADVQMRGIWCEIIAVAPDRQTWVVDAFYCDGSTESIEGGTLEAPNAFEQLRAKTLERSFPDAFGNTRQLDALAIDTGYRSHVVYAWVRKNQRLHAHTGNDMLLAIDGRDGWGKPPIGTPSLVDINLAGAKVKQGCKLWPVGTWSVKGGFYADLRKTGVKAGQERDPEGYCHFGTWLDENYFRQITAEYIADETYRGRNRKVWKPRGGTKDNHFLDCRVYNLAVAEYLGLSRMTADDWAELVARHALPSDLLAEDLFRRTAIAAPDPAPEETPEETRPAPPPPPPPSPAPPSGGWMPQKSGWMRR